MWDFNIQLIILSRGKPSKATTRSAINGSNLICGLDVSTFHTTLEKATELATADIKRVEQDKQLKNPDSKVILENIATGTIFADFAFSYQGIKTGDDGKYRYKFWEVDLFVNNWLPFQGTVKSTCLFGGISDVIDWRNDGAHHARRQGLSAWGKYGASVSQMGRLPSSIFFGTPYDSNVSIIVPRNEENATAIWAFCSSKDYVVAVRKIDQSIAAKNASMAQIPFDLKHWTRVAQEKYPHGLPKPYSDDPTQWIFHGHPAPSQQSLQVAVARLLGYRWPAELDPKMELSGEARAWVQKSSELLPLADDDGIVCLPPVRGERPAAERVLEVLAAAYGPEWSAARLTELVAAVGYAGKNLEVWLRDGFFKEHCQLFHQRPFIWHLWDGRKDGFAALVNYHKLDRKTLETLTYTYLGDWLQRQQDGVKRQEAGAEERLVAAQALQDKLKRILAGEDPYDIFIRWKPLEQQPLGWEPDLNDGVRLNIRPFMTADILRQRPKINWNKDRGKDVESAPWYNLYKGERINGHHLTLAEKAKSREAEKPPTTLA